MLHFSFKINFQENTQTTALHYAIWNEQTEVVQELLSCPKLDVNIKKLKIIFCFTPTTLIKLSEKKF